MMCGRIASGKSTLAARLAQAPNTVLLSEDHLLSRLYPGEIVTLDDYVRCTVRLRKAIGPHVRNLLGAGVSVVLDFQANTPAARAWMRELFEEAGARHQLHWLCAADAICRTRLHQRNASGTHEYQVSDADFDLFNGHVVPPAEEEGFNVVQHE
jgi:predicted kinase